MSELSDNNDRLLDLYKALKQARWHAGSAADRQLLTELADAVADLGTRINQGQIADRDAAYADASLHLALTVTQLKSLKTSISQVINDVQQAGKVLGLIDKVLPLLI